MVNKPVRFKSSQFKPSQSKAMRLKPKLFLFTISMGVVMSSALMPFSSSSSVPLMMNTAHATGSKSISHGYEMLRWEDLLPEADYEALLKGPTVSLLADGREDKIDSKLAFKLEKPRDAYQKALISKKVRSEYDGKKVKLPGFIVPIDLEGEGVVKKFFFVPYFGQCLHLPPPPPNQIVIADFDKGYEMKNMDIEKPYFLEMTLHTKQAQDGLVTSAYTGTVDTIYPYDYQ